MEAEVREREEDSMPLALKIEKGATSQEKQVASRSWERQGNRFSPRAKMNQPSQHLDVSTLRPIWTSNPQNYKITHLCGFKPLSL